MRISQGKQAIRVAIAMRHALMMWGPPGSAKSSGYAQVCEEDELGMVDWRTVELESIDLRGLPERSNGFTRWASPEELPRVRADGKVVYKVCGKEYVAKRGIVLLDELPQSGKEVKNVLARALHEGRIGEWVLPDEWLFMCAGNQLDMGAGTSPMPTHMNNRLWHLYIEPSLEDWMVNFVEPRETGGKPKPTPKVWDLGNNQTISMLPLRPIKKGEIIPIDVRVVAYLKYRPTVLSAFDPRSKEAAQATSRSWHMLSDMLYVLNGNEDIMPAPLLGEYCAGFVGRQYGNEFAGFLRTLHSLVSIEQILLDPQGAPVAKEPSICYVLATALANHVKRDTVQAALTYLGRLSKEFQFVFGYRLKRVQPTLQNTKAFVTFAAANADFI